MKVCNICKLTRDSSEFHKHSGMKDGLRSECKPCRKIRENLIYANNKDDILIKRKEYYERVKDTPDYKERSKLKSRKYYDNNRYHFIVSRCRVRARRLKLPFNLTVSDIVIPDKCPAMGIELFFNKDVVGDNSPSVDRIIPELGYVKDNIQIISNLANKMKSNATPEQLQMFANWILKGNK